MATATSIPDDTAHAAAPRPALFAYRATRHGRTVVELACFQGEAAEIVVEALVQSVHAPEDAAPVLQLHRFPGREQARQFLDEALIALEYAGCIVHDAHA